MAVTDPLSAGHADRRAVACRRLRRTGAWLFATAGLVQLAVLLAPDPDPSDHAALAVAGITCLLIAAGPAAWRRPPLAIGTVVSVVVLALTERVGALLARLERLAIYDPLTGALNRQALGERIDVELARTARTGAPFAVAMIDLDNFKALNDLEGHAAGDEALRLFGDVIAGGKRRTDLFGRIGSEEFVVVLVGTDAASAMVYADHLRARLADAGCPVTVSIGVTDTGDSAPSPSALPADADRALYRAKCAGRDRVARAAGRATAAV